MPRMLEAVPMLSTAGISVRTPDGEELWIASMVYNAAISALEVRAYRAEGTPPRLADMIGRGPLRIFEVGVGTESLRATVHFETATLAFGFECDPGARDRAGHPLRDASVVREVVILRGLRIENL